MIVTCERCDTRFRLDATRLPKQGARVRCSRCKHAFFLKPPGAREADVIDELAAEATQRAVPSPPDVTQNLASAGPPPPAPPGTSRETTSAEASPASAAEEESDWEFNADFPGSEHDTPEPEGAPAARPEHDGAGEALDALLGGGTTSRASALDELGDPGSWDFFASETSPAQASETGGTAPPASEPALAEARPEERLAETEPEPPSSVPEAPRQAVLARDEPRGPLSLATPVEHRRRGPQLVDAAGWTATGVLLLLGFVGLLAPRAASPPHAVTDARVAGLSLEDVAGRTVENAVAGEIYVVSGLLRNPEARQREIGAAVVVQLLGPDGRKLSGRSATVGEPLPLARLREDDPRLLRRRNQEAAEAVARRPLAPGEAIPFQAVFERLPPEATALSLEAVALLPARTPAPGAARPLAGSEPSPRTSPFPR